MSFRPFSLAIIGLVFSAALANASIVINFGAANLTNASGSVIPAGTLLQLVDLGADGVFNPIDIADGNTAGISRWVSGDDAVLNIAFQVIVGANAVAGDFASAAAFDLQYNTVGGVDSTPGYLERSFQFTIANLPSGTKVGLRWFPGLQAAQFDSLTLAAGQQYGEFTRQSNPKNLGSVWVTPGDGGSLSFDPLVTAAFGGPDANALGQATQVVGIPEPAAIGLSLLGAAGLSMLRRRRA